MLVVLNTLWALVLLVLMALLDRVPLRSKEDGAGRVLTEGHHRKCRRKRTGCPHEREERPSIFSRHGHDGRVGRLVRMHLKMWRHGLRHLQVYHHRDRDGQERAALAAPQEDFHGI